ncbi:hypothetical protein J4210_05640 [Candidatus Woesearchaeota archaeon]|nr:hypothetical protein [Candidatus Woesearchaeota archaeon]
MVNGQGDFFSGANGQRLLFFKIDLLSQKIIKMREAVNEAKASLASQQSRSFAVDIH